MNVGRLCRSLALVATASFLVAACSGGTSSSAPSGAGSSPGASTGAASSASAAPAAAKVRLQLQWYPQAQFAGYFAALDKGYYKDEGFDVTILPGAVEIVPATVVAGGQAEFGISWVPRMLAPRESGADGVVIGQIFQRVQYRMDVRQQSPERLVRQQDAAGNIGDDHRLFGNPDVAAELFELILCDQRPHGAELQYDVGDRLAD